MHSGLPRPALPSMLMAPGTAHRCQPPLPETEPRPGSLRCGAALTGPHWWPGSARSNSQAGCVSTGLTQGALQQWPPPSLSSSCGLEDLGTGQRSWRCPDQVAASLDCGVGECHPCWPSSALEPFAQPHLCAFPAPRWLHPSPKGLEFESPRETQDCRDSVCSGLALGEGLGCLPPARKPRVL